MKIITKSEKETFAFAKKFARRFKGGEVIGLVGGLGAGKTIFAKGLAAGLSVKQNISSPTFVLMKIYKIRGRKSGIRNFVHIDAYRIKKADDIKSIGIADYLNQPDAVVVIEWADNIKKSLPKNKILFNIFSRNGNFRLIKY